VVTAWTMRKFSTSARETMSTRRRREQRRITHLPARSLARAVNLAHHSAEGSAAREGRRGCIKRARADCLTLASWLFSLPHRGRARRLAPSAQRAAMIHAEPADRRRVVGGEGVTLASQQRLSFNERRRARGSGGKHVLSAAWRRLHAAPCTACGCALSLHAQSASLLAHASLPPLTSPRRHAPLVAQSVVALPSLRRASG
jgi:hypothetical protein